MNAHVTAALTTCIGLILMNANASRADSGLIGHWPLAGDCRDHSGNDNHGTNHGADLTAKGPDGKPGGAASFDGRANWIEIKPTPSLSLGTKDFTIAARVHTEASLDDVLGDVLSKYDPAKRRGLNLNIKILQGVTSTQANYRNVEFGIDNAKLEPSWTDCGRPGDNIFVCALAVHDGNLYAGTFESGADKTGHVYRYAGADKWIDCGSPDKANSVFCLAQYNGKLYCGTAAYRARGSALPDSPNMTPGGHVFRYEGGKKWVDCGRLGDANEVYALTVYKAKLYAIPMYSPGVFEFDGRDKWTYIGTPGDQRSMALAVWNGHLWNTGNGGAGMWRWEGGTAWKDCGRQDAEHQTYSILTCAGNMYTGTWPHGSVFRYDGGTKWTSIGRLGEELEVMAMAVYNGKLYAGTLPLANVYRYDGQTNWTDTGRVDLTPDVKYRRAWSMAVYKGRLFCGTLPSGHVWSIEAGKCATHDHELQPGWRHLAAARAGDRLKLYVDAKCVATSSTFKPADFDLANDQPLMIGFGQHDYFNGGISDVRIYDRALPDAEVAKIARPILPNPTQTH
ncbi:MAG: LamG domain-containing protein [Phycisphaerae bacterium]|nr:LamG domain-containing protein [Phycisphaerae bacterium]